LDSSWLGMASDGIGIHRNSHELEFPTGAKNAVSDPMGNPMKFFLIGFPMNRNPTTKKATGRSSG
jgi:hypothetical protein